MPVERIREVPKIEIKVVEKIRHVPGPIEYIDVPQETIVEKPVIEVVEKIIEEPEIQVRCCWLCWPYRMRLNAAGYLAS